MRTAKKEPEMTRIQIEQMYNDVFGYVVCPHGVSLPDGFCYQCGEAIKLELTNNANPCRLNE